MLLELNQIIVPPGQQLLLKNVSWQMYENILSELGEGRATKINYYQGMLEIVTPLLEHEVNKVTIGDLVKALLEELDIECRSLASTTFKNEAMAAGVEADDCFYIQNEAVIIGKKRIDLTIDPPPDLAIEIDITSRTRFNNYEALGVSELWRYDGQSLEINVLEDGKYVKSNTSRNFSQFPLVDAIPQYVEQSKVVGRNATMKAFRNWVREF
ncbi:Uma2 family endonuclease [Chroococcidiopsis sp. CCNUC1]|uniref:Uma2 family endonuclease n=1 Tax=Chroococcidiopsis sp. CCNUC1 TaxID=2653189 RepID=UPI0020213D71|nr:Uma2 family endonuclease [Chroococcidiopsis sp. CCNUC1]URD48435.1 Uma2 family endonuclease [Chroococcidiopsis sp. CCNUC1]